MLHAVVTSPLLMETDNKRFDMKFYYLVVGCAAVLGGAEPISPPKGIYQPLCTHISNLWIKKEKGYKAPISNENDVVFYLFTLSAYVRAHLGL